MQRPPHRHELRRSGNERVVCVERVGPRAIDHECLEPTFAPRQEAPGIAREDTGVAVVEAVLATVGSGLGAADEEGVVLFEHDVVPEIHRNS